MLQKVYVSDCEGPISKNDNAHELSSQIIPQGGEFFKRVSKFDDVEADVVKRQNYKAGDTLRLILPFFKAFGATDELMEDYSSENILLIPEADQVIRNISDFMPTYIVSTSYEHYIRALCGKIYFPFKDTYSTRLRIDDYKITEDEKRRLEEVVEEVVGMPVIEIPDSNNLEDFSVEDRRNVDSLEKIFFEEIPKMGVGRMLQTVNPIGGYEKANAVKDIVKRHKTDLSKVLYVGDSITDVDAFKLVREAGGLTVSFNGNSYAVREAEVGINSSNAITMGLLAERFLEDEKSELLAYLETFPDRLVVLKPENREEFAQYSSVFRKKVRGKSIGELG